MNERYNSNLKKIIKLQEGEKFCPKCDGKGRVPRCEKAMARFSETYIFLECDKCLGEGKIDWIERIVGKQRPLNHGMLAGLRNDDHVQYFTK